MREETHEKKKKKKLNRSPKKIIKTRQWTYISRGINIVLCSLWRNYIRVPDEKRKTIFLSSFPPARLLVFLVFISSLFSPDAVNDDDDKRLSIFSRVFYDTRRINIEHFFFSHQDRVNRVHYYSSYTCR